MDRLEAIERLATLRDDGILSHAEYAEQKRILMSSTSSEVALAPVQPGRQLHPTYVEGFGNDHGTPTTQIHIHNANTQNVSAPRASYNTYPTTTLVAYLLWFFLGCFGAHRFYLGHIGSGVAQLLLFLVGGGTLFVSWVVLGIWWLIDAILIPEMVDKCNREAVRA